MPADNWLVGGARRLSEVSTVGLNIPLHFLNYLAPIRFNHGYPKNPTFFRFPVR
jgi:hypothetical protein